jgi:hypothetical protein
MTDLQPAVPEKGLIARAIGVITSPGETFRAVAVAPRPVGIMFVVCVVIGLATAVPQFTAHGRQAALDLQVQQTERFTGQSVTPEAYARMERAAAYGPYITMASVVVFLPVAALFFAAIYWVMLNGLFGGTAAYKQVLGVVTHSSVIGALGALAAAPIQYLSETPSLTGPFTLGALAPMLPAGNLFAALLASINFFTLWQVVVTAIGLAVLARRRATGIALTLIGCYLVLALGIAAVSSSFTSR